MQPCGPCGCNERQAAFTVAGFAIADFFIHLIVVSLSLGGVVNMGIADGLLAGLLGYTLISFFASVLLVVGIYYDNKWFVLPWLIMESLLAICYASSIGGFIVVIANSNNNEGNFAYLFSSIIHLLIVLYFLWIIIRYVIWLINRSGYKGIDNQEKP